LIRTVLSNAQWERITPELPARSVLRDAAETTIVGNNLASAGDRRRHRPLDKALVKNHDALRLAIPLPYQDRSRLHAVAVIAFCREFGSIAGPRRYLVEEALGVAVEIAQPLGLQAIGNHAVEQMARQVIGGLAVEHRMPSCPQAGEIEIAQMRDLFLQFAH
jgi:hypothetical protein